MDQSPIQKCRGCGGELRGGVRFCVRCGTNNFDPDAGRLATAQCEISASERKKSYERFIYWWRYLMSGIRR
jgi:hypothetical protein